MAPSFSMTLRRAVFTCFTSANFVVIPVRITRAPATTTQSVTRNKQRAKQGKKVTTRLTLKILR
jgi:hypothetical protein